MSIKKETQNKADELYEMVKADNLCQATAIMDVTDGATMFSLTGEYPELVVMIAAIIKAASMSCGESTRKICKDVKEVVADLGKEPFAKII